MPRKSARKTKSSKKFHRKYKKSVQVALLVFLSVGFLGGIWLYKSLTKPFASADSSTSFDINNSDIVSLVIASVEDTEVTPVKTSSVHFLVLDKVKKKVLSYEVGLGVVTDVPGKFGAEPYSNVISLGMLSDDALTSGANLLVSSLEKDFAFNADRYLVVDDSVIDPILDTFIYGKGNDLLAWETLQEIVGSIETNITLSEFYNLFTFFRSLREDRFITNSAVPNIFDKYEVLDESIRDITFDSSVALEKASVGVLNGTNIPGIANFASRVVRNAGGHVISAENASDRYENSVLVVESTDLKVVKEIQKFFNIDTVVLKDRGGVTENIVDRVDVTFIVGFDIAESL